MMNDEVRDEFVYVRLVLRHRLRLFMIGIGCAIAVCIYQVVGTPLYESSLSFFMKDQTQSTLGNYQTLLEGSSNSSTEKKILAILESRRLRETIHVFLKKKGREISVKDISQPLSASLGKSGVYTVRFTNPDPQNAFDILNVGMTIFTELVTELGLSNHKNPIVILDLPERPVRPSKPDFSKNLIVGVGLGMLGYVSILIGYDQYKQLRKRL